MKKINEIFNNEAVRDHLKGAVMGAAFGFCLTPTHLAGAVVCGIAGAVLGYDALVEMTGAAAKSRELAYATVPARRR